jgi:hypothetical protein
MSTALNHLDDHTVKALDLYHELRANRGRGFLIFVHARPSKDGSHGERLGTIRCVYQREVTRIVTDLRAVGFVTHIEPFQSELIRNARERAVRRAIEQLLTLPSAPVAEVDTGFAMLRP